jgi:hypothetical protein
MEASGAACIRARGARCLFYTEPLARFHHAMAHVDHPLHVNPATSSRRSPSP